MEGSANSSIPRRKPLTANVGIYSVGHHTYWSQFDGLLGEIRDKISVFRAILGKYDVNVIDFGISDCAETAYAAVPVINSADLDLLFVGMAGSAGAIAGLIINPMIGVIVQNHSYLPLWIASGMLYPGAFILLILFIKRIRPVIV